VRIDTSLRGFILKKFASLFILLRLLSPDISGAAPMDLYDGFESKSVSKIWTTKRMVSSSLVFQENIVKKGKVAIQITIRPNDKFEPGDAKSLDSERDEISEANEVLSELGHEYVHEFSLFIPKDFPIVPTRLVLAQWKQQCPVDHCEPDNPVMALRYSDGKFNISAQTTSEKRILFTTSEEVRGRWLDLKFQIRFSDNKDGRIKVWLNEKEVVNYEGQTAYPMSGGYKKEGKFYFKMGLYRDLMKEPMSVYFDEYRKREISY
jgi:hypothetical protein